MKLFGRFGYKIVKPAQYKVRRERDQRTTESVAPTDRPALFAEVERIAQPGLEAGGLVERFRVAIKAMRFGVLSILCPTICVEEMMVQ